MQYEALYHVFSATLSADKPTREPAEQELDRLSSQQPGFVVELIRFSCQPIPDGADPSCETQHRNVLLAASIRARNLISRHDWNRVSHFTNDVREEIRRHIVPLQCQPHVPELIRRQLLSATNEIIRYDYPKGWPGLVPQLWGILDSCVHALRSVLPHGAPEEVVALLLQLKGGLGVLRGCCKVYENPMQIGKADADAFSAVLIPALLPLMELLLERWMQEGAQLQQQLLSTSMPPPAGNPFHFTPLVSELSHCMRLVLKCVWSLITLRWPAVLCDAATLDRMWFTCVARPTDVMHKVYLPLCRARLNQGSLSPAGGDTGDHASDFQEAAVWRMLKWCQAMVFKATQDFMEPKNCEKRMRTAAKHFCAVHLPTTAETAFAMVRWHAEPMCLTSKAFILALEQISILVSHKDIYSWLILPNAEELITHLLFPRLAFSTEDVELWTLNPVEYVRKQTNPTGDLYNAKVVSTNLMLSLAVPSKSHQQTGLFSALMTFLFSVLQTYSCQAATADVEDMCSPSMAAACRVDAALYGLHQFTRVLKAMHYGDSETENLLMTYVVPAMSYRLGFLRARAVMVLSALAPTIEWSSAANYQSALRAVITLLDDPETPVQVQTCACFSRLMRHKYAYEVITPCIADVVQKYFQVMRVMDNDAVVRTLRKMIGCYSDTLSRWALDLTDILVEHFFTVLRTASGKFSEWEGRPMGDITNFDELIDYEDDGFADVLLTADELLETFTTLVRALPESRATRASSAECLQADIFVQLQARIAPMLFLILSYQGGSTYGFMEPALMLLTTLLARSPIVAASTWRLVPCLYQLVMQGAVDYFGQMLAPLDNFVSVDPISFLFSPIHTLCEVPPFAAQISTMTPGGIVGQMCEAVLRSDALRTREISSVPKMFDSMLQNYWHVSHQYQGGKPTPDLPSAACLVHYVCQQVFQTAGTWVKRSPSLRILFANSLFSSALANPSATVEVLVSSSDAHSFLGEYVQVASTSEMQENLRPYDRNLFVLAFAEIIRALTELYTSGKSLSGSEPLQQALCLVVESLLLTQFAQREVTASTTELQHLEKRIKRMTDVNRAPDSTVGAAVDASSEDSNEWEDEEETDDDVTGFVTAMSDDDEDDADLSDDEMVMWNGGDARGTRDGAGGRSKLQSLVEEAKALRVKGTDDLDPAGCDADEDVGDDEYDDDNLLDEDDFQSPIHDINAWASLMCVVGGDARILPVVQQLHDARFQDQASAVMHAMDVVDRLIAAREQHRTLKGRLQQ